jgi:hypothetical protein
MMYLFKQGEQRMVRLLGVSLILALASTPALTQTKDQCAALAKSMPQLVKSTGTAAGALTQINWDMVIPNASGELKRAREAAGQAQANLIGALRAYGSALDDVNYHAQQCAR